MTTNQPTPSPLKQAYLLLTEAETRLEQVQREPIAIIGMACRFPGGANTPDQFWQMLHDGVDAIMPVPPDRWDAAALYDPDPDAPGKMITTEGGFITPVDQFDPTFFGISPREATHLDPQQRLLLEVAWEALDAAAQPRERLAGSRTGIFVGITTNDYQLMQGGQMEQLGIYDVTGNAHNTAAGRLAYTFGFHGPCMAIDTACSSSLVAVHQACVSLRLGECEQALAGGVNLILRPEGSIALSKARVLSPDSRSRTFDAAANGMVRGEGCGLIVLKRLSVAQRDGDNILAVIWGSSVNHDGPSSGLTTPNGPAQEAVIRQALAQGKIDPAQVSYIEAHGTATPLGDPIEAGALSAVFGRFRTPADPLLLGSVKTNIGHLEAAAGIAGIIKVVLALQHGQIPPHLHFQHPTPHIPWDKWPLKVTTQATNWQPTNGKRLAGVSSFGFSGTNGHIILAEPPSPPEPPQTAQERPFHLFTLSAQTETALPRLAEQYAHFLAERPNLPLANVCHTTNTGRAHFAHRLAVTAEKTADLPPKLLAWAHGETANGLIQNKAGAERKVVFLFTGQGSQYPGMGRELYQTQPTFRRLLQQCDEILRPFVGWSLLDVLYGEIRDKRLEIIGQSPISNTQYTQPALFALEYALAQLWQSWGVQPAVVMGHSVGELVAACVAGLFSLEDGLKLAAERGHLMGTLPQNGEMTAVFAPPDQVMEAIQPFAHVVSIAAVNGPEMVVISGAQEEITAVTHHLHQHGIETRPLATSHAFHSPLMEPILADFARIAASITYHTPQIALITNLTGQLAGVEAAHPDYWVQHARQPVQFMAGMHTLRERGCDLFVEIGPQPTLLGMGQRCLGDETAVWLPSLRQNQGNWQTMLHSLGQMYTLGLPVNWAAFDKDYKWRKVILPSYPFERQRYWLGKSNQYSVVSTQWSEWELRRVRVAGEGDVARFEAAVGRHGFWGDHVVFGQPVLPMAAYVDMALMAGQALLGKRPISITHLVLQRPFILPERGTAALQIVCRPFTAGYTFEIYSLSQDETAWQLLMTGNLAAGDEKPEDVSVPDYAEAVDMAAHYAQSSARGVVLGQRFRVVQQVRRGEWGASGRIETGEKLGQSLAHPLVLDGCLQVLGAVGAAAGQETSYLPMAMTRFSLYEPLPAAVWSAAQVRPMTAEDGVMWVDVQVWGENGRLLAQLEGLQLKRTTAHKFGGQEKWRDWLTTHTWQEQPLPAVQIALRQWLILADAQGMGQQVADGLQAKGHTCAVVYRHDQAGLAHRLAEKRPTDLIYLWGLDETDAARACQPMLEVVQLLAKQPARLWVVTTGELAQSPLWGMGRTIALEHPELFCKRLDVEKTADLVTELLIADEESEVRWRNGRRLVARLQPWAAPSTMPQTPIREDAAYLITGGLRGLGLLAAQWLVGQGARYVWLVGRSAADAASQKTINEMQTAGAQVQIALGDVADKSWLAGVMAGMERPLSGIIHAAGMVQDGLLVNQTWEQFYQVFAAKITGTQNLHELTQGQPLDFFVLYSSVAAVLGSPGQANYGAANAFMDALAHARRAAGLPAVSINWGAWAQVGLAARYGLDARAEAMGLGRIAPETGLAVLEAVMAGTAVQMVATPVEWSRYLGQFARVPSLLQAIAPQQVEKPQPPQPSWQAELMQATEAKRDQLLMAFVRAEVGAVMGSARLDMERPLPNLGMDSLMAIQIRHRINQVLGVDVPVATLLEGVSGANLAGLLAQQMGQAVPQAVVEKRHVEGKTAVELLTNLDALSDEEVERLLALTE